MYHILILFEKKAVLYYQISFSKILLLNKNLKIFKYHRSLLYESDHIKELIL